MYCLLQAPATSSNAEDADNAMSQQSTSSFDSHEPSQPAETISLPQTATLSRPAAATPSRPFKRKPTEDPLHASLFQFIEDRRLKQEDPTSIWAKNVGSTLNLIQIEKRCI